jgi:signal transduction histidine kinase
MRALAPGPEVTIEVRTRGPLRPVGPAAEAELLRIGTEAVSNAVRHGGAHRIEVELGVTRRLAVLQVRDDGSGFDPRRVAVAVDGSGFGLTGMRERAERLGGRLTVVSTPGEGTCIEARVPTSSGRA